MTRSNHNREIPQKRHLQSDREKQQPKMLKVTRMTYPEDSSLLAGVVKDVVLDDDSIELSKIYMQHPVFILDPRMVSREFKSGFEACYRFERSRKKVEDVLAEEDESIDARLTTIRFLNGSNRIIGSFLKSSVLRDERRSAYEALADSGLAGFRRREHTKSSSPLIVLGETATHIHDREERDYITDRLETGLIVSRAMNIRLGSIAINETKS